MFTNKVSWSGLTVAPANSSSVRPAMLFFEKSKICPCLVRPRRWLPSSPSSQITSVPVRLVAMLSGKSNTSRDGDSNSKCSRWRVVW